MLRYVVLALLLLTAAQGDMHLETVQASETPGLSQKEFVLVDKDADGNDQVVGHVLQIKTDGRGLGRRFGYGSAPTPLLDGLSTFMERLDFPGHILQPLHRCSMMREMNDDFTLLNERLGSRLAPVLLEGYRAATAASRGLEELFGEREPQSQDSEEEARLFGSAVLPIPVVEVADLPFQLQPVAWQQRGWEGREWGPHPGVMEGGEEEGGHHHMHGFGPHHRHGQEPNELEHHHHWMHMWGRQRQQDAPYAEWMSLQDSAVPAPSTDSINWSFYDQDGNLNMGLLGFVILSAGCLGMWVAGVVSWIQYSRTMREAGLCCPARRQFLTSQQSDLVKPLMAEGPVGSSNIYTGVEVAADHAPKDASYTGLHYEVLKGDGPSVNVPVKYMAG